MLSTKPLTLSLGEILWDILPDGKALGGAPSNVAWHAAQLGADSTIVSAVGDDALGHEILARLREMGLKTDCISIVGDKPTGTVDATLDANGNAVYVIHENVAWDHLPATPGVLALAASAQAVNFGSLAQRGAGGRAVTNTILGATGADCIRVFDINLRPPFIYRDVLADGLARATVVKMNEDELPLLAKLFGWSEDPEAALADLLAAHPGLQHAVVTRGPRGAWWRDRRRLVAKTPTRTVRVVDTIGAGDSVTATIVMGLLRGWDAERILEAAIDIASFVCSSRGGTPELPPELKAPFLA